MSKALKVILQIESAAFQSNFDAFRIKSATFHSIMVELANCSGTEKYFCGTLENNPYKDASIFFASVSMPTSIILLYAVIWFEKFGSDHKRILTNKLLSSICWTLICGILVYSVDILRYLVGPLPSSLCFFMVVAKNAVKTRCVLLYNAIHITRYVCIFWLKNPGAVKDDFWGLFLSFIINGLSILPNLVIYSLPIKQPMYYYVCADIDPRLDMAMPSKPPAIADLVSLLIFISIKVRIYVHQQKPDPNPCQSTCVLLLIEKQTITDFTSNLMGLLSLASFSIISIKINSLTVEELNQFPGFLYIFMYQMICPPIVAFTVFFMNYIRCKNLRETLHRELKEKYSEWFN